MSDVRDHLGVGNNVERTLQSVLNINAQAGEPVPHFQRPKTLSHCEERSSEAIP